jgi:hypothetical protein
MVLLVAVTAVRTTKKYLFRAMQKKCFKCEKILNIECFYKHPRMKDGHLNKCIDCTKRDVSNREKLKYSDPEWLLKERKRCIEKGRIYRAEGRQKGSPSKARDWALRNKEKRYCHNKVARAVLTGKLIKEPCEVCGSQDTQAHHDDYSKPLDVRWLCVTHHNELHRKQREDHLLSLIEHKKNNEIIPSHPPATQAPRHQLVRGA